MRFLIIAPRFHTNLYYRVTALQNAGHQVKVIVLYKGKSEYYKGVDIDIVGLSFFSSLILNFLSAFRKNKIKSDLELRFQSPNKDLVKMTRSYKPDVILLKAYQNMLAIKTLFVAKRYNVKVLMLTQTTFTHIKGSRFLFRLNIKFFKTLGVFAYITPIKSNYEAFRDFGIENVFYLPFVFPKVLPKRKHDEYVVKILSIGKFVRRKDQLLLLKAFKSLINDEHIVFLTLIGERADEKYFKEVNDYIKNNKLEKFVKVKQNLRYTDILKDYLCHDIFVLPSYAEPAAYSPVEAMAYGLPVISSNQNGTSCYIDEGKNGYVFEAKSIVDLVDKLSLIVSDKEQINKLSDNALIMAKRNHSLINFSNRINEIIQFPYN